MAGIYIHVPFCSTRCSYCDFYSECDFSNVDGLVSCEIKEIETRKDYLGNEKIETIYFGGGTPSVLATKQVKLIIENIRKCFDVADDIEVTFEANPEDLNREYLDGIISAGINRISIGIQSFDDKVLKSLNRRHSVSTAIKAVSMIREAGISNISVDLIYGIPGMSFEIFKSSVAQLIDLNVNHISAYNLTYHKGTKFHRMIDKGELIEVDDETCFQQFSYLREQLGNNGFIHYELSNFAREGFFSRHNSSYWFGNKYLGIGPSAHSFDGNSRQWNINSTEKFIECIRGSQIWYETEILSLNDKYNEYIITRLRTIWGISLKDILAKFGDEYYTYLNGKIKKYSDSSYMLIKDDVITLTERGLFISDMIMEDFFKI
jgi:oxygen-independent coproporphyrinogen-3 oxidase